MKLIKLLLILLLCFPVYGQEIIAGFEDDDLPVLNEELRRKRVNIKNNSEDIDVLEDADDSDDKVKVSANDTTADELDSKLVAGTGITLTENNDGGNETLTIAQGTGNDSLSQSNVVFIFGQSHIDATGGSVQYGFGPLAGANIATGDAANVSIYAWQYYDAAAPYPMIGAPMIKTKFKKIAGINTVTFYAYVQASGATVYPNVYVDIGGQNNTVVLSSSTTTRTWITAAIDVSSLTDGTVYDVGIRLWNTNAGGNVAMYSIIGIGS